MPLPVQVPWYQADDDTEQAVSPFAYSSERRWPSSHRSCCLPTEQLQPTVVHAARERRCAAAANVAAARDHREARTVAVLGTAAHCYGADHVCGDTNAPAILQTGW